MGRRPMAKKYRDFIEERAAAGNSNYAIEREMAGKFLGGNIPGETAIRRHRNKYDAEVKVAKEKTRRLVGHGEIDKPWLSKRIDKKDDIPSEVSKYISTYILPNDKIMNADGSLDPVTRRTAMWIATLFDRLREEDPLLIWSVCRMYSMQELLSENQQEEFDTRQFDIYLAMKPWASFDHSNRYEEAVENGRITHIREVSASGTLHWKEIMETRVLNVLKTTSRAQQDRILGDHLTQGPWIDEDTPHEEEQ